MIAACSHKTCTRCERERPIEDYYALAAGRCGRQSWCKDCLKENSRLNRHTWPSQSPAATRRRHLKRRYGLTEAALAALAEAQEGRCAICSSLWEVVDHDHVSGAVRGLLCHPCNAAIGLLKDDGGRMRAAADYVEARV